MHPTERCGSKNKSPCDRPLEARDVNEIKMCPDNAAHMPLMVEQPQHTGGAISLPHYQRSLIIRVNRSLDRWRSVRKVSVSSTKGKSAAEIKGILILLPRLESV